MNVLMRTTNAVLDFIVINAIALPLVINPISLVWYALCVALAFLLRLGLESKERNLTLRFLIQQSIFTITWCFASILFWFTFLNYTKGFEIYLFLNSLFSSYLVTQFESAFKMTFKEWLRIKIGKFIAEEKGEVR